MLRIKQIIKEDFGWTDPTITKIADEGSDRVFFRIADDCRSVILMVYDRKKTENNRYVSIQNFLETISVNVPKILSDRHTEGYLVLEDLGDENLFTATRGAKKEKILKLYKLAIDESIKIFSSSDQNKDISLVTEPEFDYNLYRWEGEYFIENYLQNHRKHDGDLSPIDDELKNLAEILSKQEKTFIHRDFQSKNLFLKNGKIYLIDFQGLRYGLPEYDLASLLQDPYVCLDENIIKKLLCYFEKRQNRKQFRLIFNLCSIQRLLQALGAFSFLGLKKGKTQFLQYIQPAETVLSRVLGEIEIFPKLEQIVHKQSSL